MGAKKTSLQEAYEEGWNIGGFLLEEELEELLSHDTANGSATGVVLKLGEETIKLPEVLSRGFPITLLDAPEVLESFKDGLYEGLVASEEVGEF